MGLARKETRLARNNIPYSLRTRLIWWVSLALLPVGIVNVLQGVERAHVDVSHVRQSLVQTVRIAASNEGNVLASSGQILRTLATVDDVSQAGPRCDQALDEVRLGMHFLVNIVRVNAGGRVICSALPGAKGLPADPSLFSEAKRTMTFAVSGQIMSPVVHKPLIAGMLPLHDAKGKFAGGLLVGISPRWLDYILKARNLPKGAVIAVFDRNGKIVATNDGGVAQSLFSRMPDQKALNGGLETRQSAQGDSWILSAAPLVGNNIFVGLAMRTAKLFAPTYLRVAMDFLLPIVMLALAGIAIWFATERQVTNWIGYLRRIAAAYRGGHYGARPALDGAPEEFQSLGNAMAEMAAGIQDRDKRLRDAVAQKTFLLRETHHRVKNNLQIVMSLLSLQSNQIKDPTAKAALAQAQARIDALALVHRLLHEVEDQTQIDLKRLLEELSQKIFEAMLPDESMIATRVDCVQSHVPSEIAVPIALFAVEALMNIFKFAFPDAHQKGAISLSLSTREAKLLLAISDNGIGYLTGSATPGIGSRLLGVFARQVHGQLTIESRPAHGTIVELVFPNPLADASTEPQT